MGVCGEYPASWVCKRTDNTELIISVTIEEADFARKLFPKLLVFHTFLKRCI